MLVTEYYTHTYNRFRRDQSGAVAVTFAVACMMLLICVGVAVDFSRLNTERTKLQMALDSAVLAGAAADDRVATANDVLNANLSNFQGNVPVNVTWDPSKPDIFAGAANATLDTTFMQLAMIRNMLITVQAAASLPEAASTVTFTLQNVKGWFWKRVTVWTHEPGASSDTLAATFTYQPTNLLNDGTGDVWQQLPGDPSPGTPLDLGRAGADIVLGNTYDYGYLQMEVSPDGCGPGYAPQYPSAINDSNTLYWNPYSCIPATTKNPKTAVIYTMRTNDPATANHLFVDGVQLSSNAPASMLNLFRCGKIVQQAWEDSQIYTPNNSAWATQDFIFTVNTPVCQLNQNLKEGVRLVQ